MSASRREQVLEGLAHLAFGTVQDPVRLLFCEEVPPSALKKMDLFSISEIKRPKGGGMEIRFYDRIKALQCLAELDGGGEEGAALAQALEEGARALWQEEPPCD